jgi:hypothetical protein
VHNLPAALDDRTLHVRLAVTGFLANAITRVYWKKSCF